MIFNLYRIYIVVFVCLIMHSCNCQTREAVCINNFHKAQRIVNTFNLQKLDSALYFVNKSLECKENRVASVELKVAILFAMGHYSEGAKFVDSLNPEDFFYMYRKQMLRDNFRTMTMDSVSRKELLGNMDITLTSYINTHRITRSEEESALIELYEIKERYMSPLSINSEIDSLIKVKPDIKYLLDKLRISKD